MPLVWRAHPALKLVLGGTGALEAGRDLAEPRVTVLPDADAVPGRVMAAGLRCSAGVHAPILCSLAAGLPCAMTKAAATGPTMTGPLTLLLAADDAQMAATILVLHRDQATYAACAAAGIEMVRRDWSHATVDAALRGVVAAPAARRQLD